MSLYTATVHWQRDGAPFVDNRYSRAHRWEFDGGVEVPASSSPSVVPLPMSDAAAVDPEEAFVAALSSCHMLWFLSIAAGAGFVVESYDDAATGTMARNGQRQLVMTLVLLRPRVAFAGTRRPDAEEFATLHHRAHDACYLANSVKTEVRCEPQLI
ncbi:MAG TPA: OsmC family protein [Rubrivivax sp.]